MTPTNTVRAAGAQLLRCSHCKVSKPAWRFNKNAARPSGLANQCKSCLALRYIRNRPAILAKYRVANRQSWRKRRTELVALLGGKCLHCGFDDPRALCVDHVNGGGHQEALAHGSHSTMTRSILTRLQAGEDWDKYQLLCANCNMIKRHENGEGVVLEGEQ